MVTMNRKIIIKPNSSEQTWEDTGEPVKLWELMPCEDFSKYSKEVVKMMLQAMYRVQL